MCPTRSLPIIPVVRSGNGNGNDLSFVVELQGQRTQRTDPARCFGNGNESRLRDDNGWGGSVDGRRTDECQGSSVALTVAPRDTPPPPR